MAKGTISASILTDIANAIRKQAGVGTTYKPSEMADAVAALDGTDAGGYVERAAEDTGRGLLTPSILTAIADAIRGQNGETTTYKPGEMAAAILALTWKKAKVPRALLLKDGTLEFNCCDAVKSDLADSADYIVQVFEIDPAGYTSSSSIPWKGVLPEVKSGLFDADFVDAGVTNFAYWFLGMVNMTDVYNVERMGGGTDYTSTFTSCASLESLWCGSETFDASGITKGTSTFYGCKRLVGQTGYVPTYSTSASSALNFGARGVLTTYVGDARHWAYGHVCEGGRLIINGSADALGSPTELSCGRLCVEASYNAVGAPHWYEDRETITSVEFADLGRTVNLNYWFYGMTKVASVTGLGSNKLGELRHAFNTCKALTELDLRGLDPSTLSDNYYAFANCTALKTITVDSTWTLYPQMNALGTFYNCTSLVGGAGTTFDSSKVAGAYMRIDGGTASPGYLTAG